MSVRRGFGAVRVFLLLLGLALVAAGIQTVASTTPAPPTSDGFLEGLAYLSALVLGTVGLLVVQLGYAFPAGTGRLRGGPLADRSAGTRCGVVVVAYVLAVLLMVYGIPALVPSVTGSTTYASILFFFALAAIVGVVPTLLVALGGLLVRTYRRRTRQERPPKPDG